MALTVTIGLTNITTAEAVTGWTSYGAGGSGAMALEPDFFSQGSNSLSRGAGTAATVKGMCFDIGSGATINFSGAGANQDKLVYIWIRAGSPGIAETIANGGVRVILGSGATAPGDAAGVWSAWYVDGSNTLKCNDNWVCYVIDPQSTASTTYGGGVDKTAIRWFGAAMKTSATGTAKGQVFGVDRIAYGRGELLVSGTVATAGAGFKEIAAADWGDNTNGKFGIITEKNGIYYVRGKIIIGHATSNTTFSSYGETVVFESPHYYNTNIVKSIPDASVNGVTGSDGKTSYVGLGFIGGSGTTTIDIGIIAGTDGGRSGSNFICPNNSTFTTPAKTLATVSVDNSTMALSIYGSSFVGFEGAFDLQGTGVSNDDCFSNTFNGCGRLDSNMEIRNCNVINSVAVATDGAYIWNSTTNLQKCLFANNSRAIVFESTTGTPFSFVSLTFSGNTYDVRNESLGSITIDVSLGGAPSVEDSGGGSVTTVNAGVVTGITVIDVNTGANIENANVLVLAAAGGPMPSDVTVTIVNSGTTATVTHTGHAMLTNDKVQIKGASLQANNGTFSITKIDDNSYSYTMGSSPGSSPTGTIKATYVAVSGLTNASGYKGATKSFTANQPIVGKVRRATVAYGTLYKTGNISGTINKDTGFTTTVQMIPDV